MRDADIINHQLFLYLENYVQKQAKGGKVMFSMILEKIGKWMAVFLFMPNYWSDFSDAHVEQ